MNKPTPLKSTAFRVFGLTALLATTQLLSACVVVPVPTRHRAVVVQPAYGYPAPSYDHRDHRDDRDGRDGRWRR